MVMSPQTYAWRLERKGLKHTPKTYEIKIWQKDLRKKTVKVIFTGVMAIILVISLPGIFQKYFSHAKGYQWIQNSWDSTLNATNGDGSSLANAAANLTGWTKFWSKNSAITASDSSGIALKQYTQQTATEDGTVAHPYSGSSSGSGMYPSSVAQGAYVANGSIMNLKKPQGATCGTAAECAGTAPTCTGSTCCQDVCCGATPSANGITYSTVAVGTQCWLKQNLGAPNVAVSSTDYANYGWLFQWGRGADNHQLVTWTSATTGTPVNAAIAGPNASNAPGTSFIESWETTYYDWLLPQVGTLWNGNGTGATWSATGIPANQNPCPTGFHVPTQAEWQTFYNATPTLASCGSGSTCLTAAYNSPLKLTAAGLRNNGGALTSQGSSGNYWSSTPFSANAYYLYFYSSGVLPASSLYRVFGFSVRCVKN